MNGVTAKDRVRAALELDSADRPPIGLWGHDYLKEWSASELAETHVRAQNKFGWDFVKFQPRATCFAEAFGAQYRPSGNPHTFPAFLGSPIRTPKDWDEVEAVPATVRPLADQVESLAEVCAGLGPDVPVIQTVFSPLSVADFVLGRGPGSVVSELREHAGALEGAMEAIARTLIDFARRSVDAGASGIFFAVVGLATAGLLTEDEYEDLVLPFDLKVIDALPSEAWFNVVHLCGPRVHFRLLARMSSNAVSWAAHEEGNPNLSDGLELLKRAAMGGIQQKSTLLGGDEEAIAHEVRAAAETNGGKGVIIAGECSIPTNTPEENIYAASRAVGAIT